MEKKCFVQIEMPIVEYSSHGRLQFHHEGQMVKYDLVLRNRSEIAEA
jgi:lipoate-protein ligase B